MHRKSFQNKLTQNKIYNFFTLLFHENALTNIPNLAFYILKYALKLKINMWWIY